MSNKKFKLSVPVESYASLKEVADRRQLSIEELLKHAIKLELVLDQVFDNGGKVIIEDGEYSRQLVF